MTAKDRSVVEQLFKELKPKVTPTEEILVALFSLASEFGSQYIADIWAWNRKHKSGGLRFTGVSHMATALQSNGENSARAQFADHVWHECPKCKPKKGGHAEKNLELHDPANTLRDSEITKWCEACKTMHKGGQHTKAAAADGGFEHEDPEPYDAPKGFDIEEA